MNSENSSIEIELLRKQLKDAQDALVRAEDVMDNASDMVQNVDAEGNLSYANHAWLRTMGYSHTEAIGRSIFDFIHPRWLRHYQELFERIVKGETVSSVSTVFLAKDGHEIAAEGNVNTKYTAGKVVSTCGIFRDVSAKQKDEAKRREAEERYTALFNDSTEGIVQYDTAGTLIAANPAMAQMLGYASPEELIQRLNANQPLYVHDEDRINLVRAMVRRGTAQGYECRLIRKDGGVIWVRGSGRAVRGPDDKLLYFEGIIIDMTERKLAELERDRFFNLSQHFFCIAGFDGYIKKINPAWLSLGYSAEELLSRPFIDFVHPDDRDATILEVQRITQGIESIHFGNRYRCRDGSYRWLLWNAAPALERKVIYASARDITDIKMFEAELMRNNLELENRNRRIEEASRLKSEFLANMSHELRTPLNGIIGFSELMYNEDVGPVSAEQKEFLGDVLSSARHLLQLINDILDLSKVEAGKLDLRPEACDLYRVIHDVCDSLHALAAPKQIDLQIAVDERVRDVFLDPGKFKQVLYNYLSNALKFTPEKGRVCVSADPVGDREFRLLVVDSGIGIEQNDIARLFVEFQQLDEGASKKYQGTGLGLALTKRIVEAQGGRVGVTSVPGAGSTFYAILPLRAKPSEGLSLSNTLGSGAKILIVDDDPSLLKLMGTTLQSLGYVPICIPDAEEGLAAIKEDPPHAVILDLMMPGMDGFEFLQRLRSERPKNNIPVIVWTNRNLTPEDNARLRELSQGVVLKQHGDVAMVLEELRTHIVSKGS